MSAIELILFVLCFSAVYLAGGALLAVIGGVLVDWRMRQLLKGVK